MDTSLSTRNIDIADLRKAPVKVFAEARNEAVGVLKRKRPVGYIVSPRLMARLFDQLMDKTVAEKSRQRADSLEKAQKTSVDKL